MDNHNKPAGLPEECYAVFGTEYQKPQKFICKHITHTPRRKTGKMTTPEKLILLVESWVEFKKAEDKTHMTLEISEYLDDLVSYIKRNSERLKLK